MKKILLLSIIVATMCSCVGRGNDSNNNNSNNNNGNSNNNNNTPIGWILVGEADISGAEAATPILKFHNNIPYVAFLDEPYPYGASLVRVMKYILATDTWENVGGNGFSAGSHDLAFEINSSTGDLYLAYSDGTNSEKLTVRMFDGSSWNDVGGIGISSGAVEHVALTIKGGVTPYVAYYDTGAGTVIIQKYTLGAWSIVTGGLAEPADSVSLASDSNNIYLSTIISSSKLLDIKKYDSSEGETTIASPTPHEIKDLSSVFNGDHLYVTAIDLYGSADKVALLRYNVVTLAWTNVGTSAYISDGIAGVPSMYVHNNGISDDVVYIAYRDNTVSNKASVKFCLDDPTLDWSELGGLGFSDTSVVGISLYYDDGHPYVAYVNTTTDRIEVRKY